MPPLSCFVPEEQGVGIAPSSSLNHSAASLRCFGSGTAQRWLPRWRTPGSKLWHEHLCIYFLKHSTGSDPGLRRVAVVVVAVMCLLSPPKSDRDPPCSVRREPLLHVTRMLNPVRSPRAGRSDDASGSPVRGASGGRARRCSDHQRGQNPIPRIPSPNPEIRSPKPEARSPKPETRSPEPETRNPKPET